MHAAQEVVTVIQDAYLLSETDDAGMAAQLGALPRVPPSEHPRLAEQLRSVSLSLLCAAMQWDEFRRAPGCCCCCAVMPCKGCMQGLHARAACMHADQLPRCTPNSAVSMDMAAQSQGQCRYLYPEVEARDSRKREPHMWGPAGTAPTWRSCAGASSRSSSST
jgi:hypothetical protein